MLTWDWQVFALGAAGAFAPEIVRLWGIRTEKAKFAWSRFYLFASVLMCGLGGLLALCLEPDSAWKALYGGVTTPILISSIAKKGLATTRSKLKSIPYQSSAQAQPSAKAFFGAL